MSRAATAAVLALAVACSDVGSGPREAVPAGYRLALPGGSVTMTVAQRSTTPIPGSEGAIRLTVDDVTRGQVLTSIATSEGAPVLAPISLRPGESSSFELDGRTFRIELDALKNRLVGTDHAVFTLAAGAPAADGALTEAAKIRLLIERLRSLERAVFIRNDAEHEAAEAAAHLERKWSHASDEVGSATEFIEEIASRSSLTGEEYRIRFADGTETTVRAWLERELAGIERGIH